MRINRPELSNLLNKLYRQEQGRNQASSATSTSSSPSGEKKGDRVEISNNMETFKNELSRLEEEVDGERAEKLAALARRIENGDYRVDAEELAGIMLEKSSSPEQ